MSNKYPFPDDDDLVWFYDQNGEAQFYLYKKEHFYHVDGTPIGYLHENKYVVGYNGEYLGWIYNGWVIDYSDGSHAFFWEFASGGLVRPVRKVRPIRGIRAVRPIRSVRSIRPVRPLRSLSWTRKDIVEFFPDYA